MLFRNTTGMGCARRILALTIVSVSIMLVCGLSPALAESGRTIKVMTQNMDAGTDLGFVFGMEDTVAGAQLTYQEITTQGEIPRRAQRLAAEIIAAEPDLINLQEVTTWAVTSTAGGTQILYDQLNLLMNALAERRAHYQVVATQPLMRAEAPLDYEMSQFLRFSDSNVILAREDNRGSDFHLSNVRMDRYTNLFIYGPFTEVLGWMSVDVEIHGKKIRCFNTHLTSPFVPEMEAVQILQGDELISVLDESPYPVILAGDFNSDASPANIGPDLTPTAGNIASAGYTDVWAKLHAESDYGLTWPRFKEDVYPVPTSPEPATPTERIDIIYEKGLTPLNIKLIYGTKEPLASDHMGVMAILQVGR
jgi:endonuclease/exonuclease/phosphatase family metal-dependent hydrolase